MSLAQPSHMTEYRKVHSGGDFQPHPRQRPHNFLVPKWG